LRWLMAKREIWLWCLVHLLLFRLYWQRVVKPSWSPNFFLDGPQAGEEFGWGCLRLTRAEMAGRPAKFSRAASRRQCTRRLSARVSTTSTMHPLVNPSPLFPFRPDLVSKEVSEGSLFENSPEFFFDVIPKACGGIILSELHRFDTAAAKKGEVGFAIC
jgi:hypothetical protein